MCIRDSRVRCALLLWKGYIGTTKRTVRNRVGEHRPCCRLWQPEKSEVAEHALANADRRLPFEETKISWMIYDSAVVPRRNIEPVEIFKRGFAAIGGDFDSPNSPRTVMASTYSVLASHVRCESNKFQTLV